MSNKSTSTLIADLKELYQHFPLRRRTQSKMFFGLIFLAAFAEIFSIGIVIPFLSAVMQPNVIFLSEWAQPILALLNITTADSLPFVMTIIFILVITVASLIRLLHTWFLVMLAHRIGADLSQKAFSKTISLPYEDLILKNSNDLISTLFVKINLVVIQIIAPCFSLATSLILTIGILFLLVLIEPLISLSILFSLSCFYGITVLILRSKMLAQGDTINIEQNKVIRFLQEALGSIRDMILDNSQKTYSYFYKNSDNPLRIAQAKIEFYRLSPRYIIEAFVMIIFAFIALFLISSDINSPESSIAIMGALAMGGIKLLPIFQNGYAGWTGIKSHHSLLIDTLNLLREQHNQQIIQENREVIFDSQIAFDNISFTHKGSEQKKKSLDTINLTIPKGARIGITGLTGSGKSTLADIFMGLLTPSSGRILIDDEELSLANIEDWRKKISHVPQSIFLTDTSIASNISLAAPDDKINFNQMIQAAKGAQIHDVISSWPAGYDTIVGERGIKLSGGELQRIGLARALYKDPEILVLDEATSALDDETEASVMNYIYTLKEKLTIIIIAHRKSTLKDCTAIIELSQGKISKG
jgi:ATP-binding cassette, subfamily B, bacterial PglK|tara:strand:- start:7741 stop:9498 length:1758 start_codon:yes stop_codon:yes gene_type:complete